MIIGVARTSTLEQVAGLEAQVRQLEEYGCERVYQEQVSSVGERVNQTGFTGEHKAWKVSHDQRKFREPFFDRSAGARSAFGA